MIAPDLVFYTIKESFGAALAESPGFSERMTRFLHSYSPCREPLSSFSRKMEEFLFNALYDLLGSEMTIRRDDGTIYRIYMADLPVLADNMLFPLFASFSSSLANYNHLHDYWMKTGSLSAMRALYLCFTSFLPLQEADLIRRIAEENIPVSMLKRWFTIPGLNPSP